MLPNAPLTVEADEDVDTVLVADDPVPVADGEDGGVDEVNPPPVNL